MGGFSLVAIVTRIWIANGAPSKRVINRYSNTDTLLYYVYVLWLYEHIFCFFLVDDDMKSKYCMISKMPVCLIDN